MALRKFKVAEPRDAAPARPRPTHVADGVAAAPSPARELQALLETTLASGTAAFPRRSRRAGAAFMLATCGAFWAAVAVVVIRAIA